MTYIKNTWVDQDVERPKTYEVSTNQDGSITLTDSFGTVTELGTPVNATNMNHIEDGIEQCYTDLADTDLSNLSATGEARLGGNKVDRTGDTMTGTLQMSSSVSPQIIIKDPSQVAGTPPASGEQLTKIEFQDSNGTMIGYIQNTYNADGERTIMINTRNGDCSDRATLILGFDANGVAYSQAVNPQASSNGTQIATTKWVKDFAKTSGSNYMSTFSKAQKGYYKFTNGLIINWGETEFAKTGTEVSFATGFTSTNYQVAVGVKSTDAGNTSVGGAVMSKNTSKFKAYGYKSGGNSAALYWIAIGY